MNGKGTLIAVSLLMLGVLETESAEGQELVLCNALGSTSEVENSVVGAGFQIHADGQGGVQFVPGIFGGALATTGGQTGGGGYLMMEPVDFFGADRERGTVEVWIQKRTRVFTPFRTPLLGIFGAQPYDYSDPIQSYSGINSFWSDGFTGTGGLMLSLSDGVTGHSCSDLGWDQVAVGQWVHVAYVWDLSGIEGTNDRLRIYRDGQLRCANSAVIPSIVPFQRVVKVLGHHAYGRFGQPTAYLDHLKVWDSVKLDFSDRFVESCAGSNQPPVAACMDVETEADGDCLADASIDAGSYDPDDDPIELSQEPPSPYGLGETLVTLVVEDDSAASDQCEGTVTVEDLAAPIVECNSPASITPPEAPVSFTATGSDNCSVHVVEVTSYDCYKYTKKGKRVDKTDSCVVTIDGAMVTVVDGGGVGTHITWLARAVDGSGNPLERRCEVEVLNPGQGLGTVSRRDHDGDGIRNRRDRCPRSNLSPTVTVAGCDSGVANDLSANGCTLSDRLAICDQRSRFTRCIQRISRRLQRSGLLTRVERRAIRSCAR